MLIIPYPKLFNYDHDYSFWKEFCKPKSNIFIELDTMELYKHWNGQVILDFKWNAFGFNYYIGIWITNIMLMICSATVATTQLSDDRRNTLLAIIIILGLFHLNFEIRRFVWNPVKYISDLWNYFGKRDFFFSSSSLFDLSPRIHMLLTYRPCYVIY